MRLARLAFTLLLATSAIVSGVAACSSDPAAKSVLPTKDDPVEVKDSSPRTIDPPGNPDAFAPGSPGRIFSHTADTLYLYDPTAKVLTKIGKFSCLTDKSLPADDAVLDIALDRTEQLYGTTFYAFIKIDPVTATCTVVQKGAANLYPNSLSFVPAGTVDPTKEALVGYVFDISVTPSLATVYSKIDTETGIVTPIGKLNTAAAPKKWASSGDMISLIVAGNKSYLTVKLQSPPSGSAPSDSLAEIDPVTGGIRSIIGPIGEEKLFGLGYWSGKAYGFGSSGHILEISTSTGQSSVVFTLSDAAGLPVQWYGAGVSTQAPLN